MDNASVASTSSRGSTGVSDHKEWYTSKISRSNLLTKKSETELGNRVRKNKKDLEARNELVNRNLRFAFHWARKYQWTGVPLGDLTQAANEGLMVAASKFDPRRGRFTTYATWQVRKKIHEEVSRQKGPIYIPVAIRDRCRVILETMNDPKLSDLEHSERIKATAKATRVSVKMVQDTLRITTYDHSISLDGSLALDEGNDIGDKLSYHGVFTSSQSLQPDQIVEIRQEIAHLQRGINDFVVFLSTVPNVSQRDAVIIMMFFGIGKFTKHHTLDHIGKLYDLTRQGTEQAIRRTWERVAGTKSAMTRTKLVNDLKRIEFLEEFADR